MQFPTSWQNDPICEFLIRGIATGALLPGQKLPTERELCLQFERPRGSVRESLAVLEGNGLIVRQVGRGTFVAGDPLRTNDDENAGATAIPDISPVELIDARLAFEPSVVDLATKHATGADLRHITRCHEHGKAALDYEQFERADRALHLAFGQATHNGLIMAVLVLIDRVRDSTEWGATKRSRHASNPARRRAAIKEHEALVAAICERNPQAAKDAIVRHLLKVREHLVGY